MGVILLGGDPPGSPPTAFSGLQFWFEAGERVYTDTAGTTPATNGQEVKGWRDKVSNYLVPGASGPDLNTTGLNGRAILQFAAGDQLFTSSNDADNFVAAASFTGFAVIRHSAATPAQQFYFVIFDGSNYVIGLSNTAGAAQYRALNYDGTVDSAVKAATLNAWGIASMLHTGGNLYVGANDTRTASMGSVASGNTSVGANANLYIKNAPASGEATDIAELIFYNTALTEGERQQVEMRLAWKYGITLAY